MSTATLLVVEHEEDCPPGWMGEWLAGAGARLDVRRPYRGEPLPESLAGHDGLLVLGGSMGAQDDATHAWLTTVKHLVRVAVRDHVPTLGICLGHQLCAAALGGRVEPNPRGQQLGVLDVGWTAAADTDPLLGPVAVRRPSRAVQWNNDLVVEAPPGCVVLARTPSDEVQAARYAPTVWGVQWHPEADERIVRRWAEHDRDHAVERGVDLDHHLAQIAAAEQELRATWLRLAETFTQLTARAQALS